jgi:phosphoenolpyruvate phosphomutase
MEAHNALSAIVAQRAGFDALWASGLTISAANGVRDANELSWTQVCDVVESIVAATQLRVLVDGDTGHGNFNNARRFSRRLEQSGAAGICIEDKLFPKTNSFVGEAQELAAVDEVVGKLKSILDSRRSSEFTLVARVEALVSGRSLAEALDRAHAYGDAGADAILIHSKQKTHAEIEAFCRSWRRNLPLVVVPTTYNSVTQNDLSSMGVSAVIWANHLLRAALEAMDRVAREIRSSRSVAHLDGLIAPIGRIFDYTKQEELLSDERRYLPQTDREPSGHRAYVEKSHTR